MHRVVASLVLVLVTAAAAAAQSTVFIVRHAERADAGTAAAKMAGADPDLSAAGRDRAASLAGMLKDARLTAIFTSEYKRTHQTAEPLARAAGLSPTQVPSKDIKTLVDKVTSAAGNVLVVGHSTTIPELLKGLGVSDAIEIGEGDFDNLFIVVRGAKPVLIRLHYPGAQRGAAFSPTPQDLARIWDAEHVSPALPPLMTHADVLKRLDDITRTAKLFTMEKIGESVEGRSLNLVHAGSGAFHVLLWSQMHGDEPTATAALFDIFEYLRRHREDPSVQRMLSALTLHVLPMLNPDGAERFQRRNAQSIDINRDALRLQTPEGRTLKAVRDRLQPRVGFNLHNQAWRTSVSDPPQPASISLLSVAFDQDRSDSPGRTLTKKICAVIRDALEPLAAGQIGRYDDEFEVRAFGDNLTLWGTPVVLIETGGWPALEPDPALVRLNFIAILTALDTLATGAVNDADPQRYESLPMNESQVLYLLVKNASVINGAGVPPFVADIGIIANRRVRDAGGSRQIQLSTTIDDMGDLRTLGALRTIDASGMTAVPLVNESMAAGQIVDLPEWKTVQASTIAVGQPARLALLKPAAEPGKYQVQLVLK